MIIDIDNPTLAQSLVIAGVGIKSCIFAFMPVLLVTINRIKEFQTEMKTHIGGMSAPSFFVEIVLYSTLSAIAFIVVTSFLEVFIPNLKPIADATPQSLLYIFWTIPAEFDTVQMSENIISNSSVVNNNLSNNVKSTLFIIKTVRMFAEFMSVFVFLSIMFFSLKIAFALLNEFATDSARHNMFSIVMKIIVGFTIALFANEYYSTALSQVVGHNSFTIRELQVLMFTNAAAAAGINLY